VLLVPENVLENREQKSRDMTRGRRSVHDERPTLEEAGAAVPQSGGLNYVISARRVPLFPAISRILLDFGRPPGTVSARNCNVEKRAGLRKAAAAQDWRARGKRILIKPAAKSYLYFAVCA
jgi:hypothetical protein